MRKPDPMMKALSFLDPLAKECQWPTLWKASVIASVTLFVTLLIIRGLL